jgi:hypothetical protein
MKLIVAAACLLFAASAFCQRSQLWVLESSTLTYHMSHPMHEVDGVSRAAKGKGICQAGTCNFLIAAPVNSFNSGDSNRDLHMIQVTRGAEFPMVVVRTTLPEAMTTSGTIYTDIEVQFAGQTVEYRHLPFAETNKGNHEVEITGTIPATCSDFKIVPPSFLMIPIKNEIPVHVDMIWRLM